jgi:hypothetical protein
LKKEEYKMIENVKGEKDEKTKDICITCKQYSRSIGEKKSNIEKKESAF